VPVSRRYAVQPFGLDVHGPVFFKPVIHLKPAGIPEQHIGLRRRGGDSFMFTGKGQAGVDIRKRVHGKILVYRGRGTAPVARCLYQAGQQ